MKKFAVVTGASSGIGRATVLKLADGGATVFGVGRDSLALDKLVAESTRLSGKVIPEVADVTDVDQIDNLFEGISSQTDRISILINAAGVIKNGSIENTSLTDWDAMMNINTRAVFYTMQKFLPLLESAKGNIVNVSSVTGLRAFPNVLAYCVSKAAVDQLTRCAALELAPKGIRVNAVNPGVVVTNLHKRGGMNTADYEKFLEHAKNTHPIGRAGEATEVADLICFLASDSAEWITGGTYSIDGGRAQTCAR